ncbi:ferredoxin [Thermococcus sp. M39]|uniref:4Fe-4S dicluster domain-containing protein n=1 Tax=unclassified Thermococcus TaxID=2627626 RepID=UPI001439D9DB|nr:MULTISPECIES: 4Fe-4S dicluster domain-containing protein [unclassified Thermococcus]NJE07092.1 ferredoxin [Thermococcus sp. M39]NJE13702.1 ferredoxin [Thermococcus sp. LS2]
MGKKIFIDFRRCIACKACEVACEMEHGEARIRVFEFPDLTSVAFNCRHCEKAPCMEVCPVNALSKDEDGAVILDPLKCIGCLMCGLACPFGVPKVDEYNKIMDKCDLCAHRRAEGKLPACVSACPTEALKYGDINDVLWAREGRIIAQLKDIGDRTNVLEAYIIR